MGRAGSAGGKEAERVRAAAAGVAVLLSLVWATPAEARWENTREIVMGSAHTFERGTFSMGIFSPLQYGVLDELTIGTHPVLDLLLTPNVSGRVRLYEGAVVTSLQLGYQQTFLSETAQRFPGTVHVESLTTVPLSQNFGITWMTGYAWRFATDVHHVPFGGTLHILLGRSDLIMLQVVSGYSFRGEGWNLPTGLLFYAHAWHRFHLGGGLSVGRFVFMPWEDIALETGGVSFYPVLDAWWEF